MFVKNDVIRAAFLILVLVIAASVTGCGSAATEQPAAATAPAAAQATGAAVSVTQALAAGAAEETTVPAAQPTAAAESGSGGEKPVTILVGEDPPSFNGAIGDTGYDSMVMRLVLLGMTGIDPEGRVFPRLAAELPTVENGGVQVGAAGTMTVTWKLRPEVTWADGTPLTADDVVFTYEAITNPSTGTWIQGIDYLDGVEKVDDHTVRMFFNTPYPGYLTIFGGEQVAIWPKHYCDAGQGFTNWDCGRKPLSSGPFMLEEWVSGDHLSFVRNPKYYEAGKPQIERVMVKVVPDPTVRKTMLQQGDGDVIMWATEQIAHELKDDPAAKVSISPTSRWVFRLFMNLAARGSLDPAASPHPVLSDVRVRRAIRMAIDVDSISSSIFQGYSQPAWTEFFREPYVCAIPRPKYDPEAAKALLEEAGWKDSNGDGVRECVSCASAPKDSLLEMEMMTYAEYGEPLLLTQQLVSEMLGKVGFQIKQIVMQGSVLWADVENGGLEQSGNFDIDLYDDGYSGTDPTDFISQYYASASAEPGNGWNVGRWINPQMDDLIGQAYSLDEAQRQALFCQMAQILEDDLPQILLFSAINAEAYASRLEGVQANLNDLVTWNAADWRLTK